MKPRSAKSKGRKLQKEVQEKLLRLFEDRLEPDDIRVAIMGQSGEDIILSPAARKLLPYSFECKNTEKLNIWSAIEQSQDNCKEGLTPVVAFRRNHTKPYIAIELEHFLELISSIDKLRSNS